MPGLLRGIGRTAVVAGTATAVSNRVSRRQAGRWAAQDGGGYVSQVPAAEAQVPVPPPAEAPGPTVDPTAARLAQLRELGALHQQGILTDEEFAVQKDRILGG